MAVDIQQLNKELGKIQAPASSSNWTRIYEEMVVHTMGTKPEALLDTRRPNESPEVYDYRCSIYEPITKGAINRAIDQLYRIFLNTNHSVQKSEDLETYLTTKRYNRKDFMSYIQTDVLKRMIEDPNGLLIWLPAGEGLTDPSQKVDVEPTLVLSEDILVLSHDLIVIQIGGDKINRKFLTLDEESIYIHTEGKRSGSFSWELIYTHNLGRVPAILLGGNTTEQGHLESYFSPFLPFANEAIRQYSDWQAVMVTMGFPFREEVADDCDSPACNGGQVICDDDDGDCNDGFRDCGRCGGTGLKRQKSPYGVFTRPRVNGAIDDIDTRPSISFVSPPADILKYSQESWEMLLDKAEQALHLKFVDQAQSGVAKIIDRENQYSFLSKICGTVFDGHIRGSLWIIEHYRNISGAIDPVVIKPSSFTVKSEQDLINEITELKNKNAPSPFIIEATRDLAKRRFSGNEVATRMVDVVVAYDPIFHLTVQEKNMLQAAGGITQADVIRSTNAYNILQEIVDEEGPEILESSITVLKRLMDAKIDPLISAISPTPLI